MIGLVPIINNDYFLALIFSLIIIISFRIKKESHEGLIFVSGFFLMIFFEFIFISTQVEVFYRNSLFGIMPVWLPILWAYGFVAISRAVKILDK